MHRYLVHLGTCASKPFPEHLPAASGCQTSTGVEKQLYIVLLTLPRDICAMNRDQIDVEMTVFLSMARTAGVMTIATWHPRGPLRL